MTTPKINNKFRFDDGTIGTITGITTVNRVNPAEIWEKKPAIEVYSRKFGYSTFAIASIEYIRLEGSALCYWQVIED